MPIITTNMRISPSVDFGSGGMPFFCPPPTPGFALIGIVVRTGHWIDQVTPIFAEMLEDGSLGPAILGPAYGGHGGVVQELRCAPGYVATGMQTRSGSYVDAIRLHQTRWDGALVASDASWTPWVGGLGGVERPERLAEPVGGAIVMGVSGRAGQYVDNLTILSGEPMRVAGTSVAKATGRATKSAVG